MRILHRFHFEIVRGCQLLCRGCPVSGLRPKVECIPVELFERCLAHVDVRRVLSLRLFNFGEPLLHPDLPRLLRAVPRQRWTADRVEVSTNGQVECWERLEAALGTGVLTHLSVSCDGDGTPESYERLRPPSRWPRLLQFLERVAEIRDRCAPQVRLGTRTIVFGEQDRERWRAVLEPRGWSPRFRRAFALPDAAEDLTDGRPPGRGACLFMAPDLLYVDVDGQVVPCCAHPRAALLGSLADQPLSRLLAGPARRDHERAMQRERESLSACRRCEFSAPGWKDRARTALHRIGVPAG